MDTSTPLTAGQAVSQQMGDVGRGFWFGTQTGPEQVWQSPDARYSYGPSTKQIMAETTTDIGIGLAGGGVVRVAAPAAQTAKGTLGRIYKGSKYVMGGAAVVGTGAFGYQTVKQIEKGDTRGAAVGALGFGAGTLSFGLSAGVFDARSNAMIRTIKQASEWNIRTGTPGSIRAGMKGTIQGRDILNTKTTTSRGVQIFQHIEDAIYKPSGEPKLFLEQKMSQPGGKIISFGGAEAQSRVIPGIKKPISTHVLTGMEYRSPQTKGVIRQTRSFIYSKYDPEFKPYVEMKTTSLKFKEPSIDITGKTKPVTKPYVGKAIPSGRGFIEFEKPIAQFEKKLLWTEMEPPVFRVYPPEAMFRGFGPIGLQLKQDMTVSGLKQTYGGFSTTFAPASKDISLRVPSFITKFINRSSLPAQISPPFTIPRQGKIQEPSFIPRSDFVQTPQLARSMRSMEEQMSRYMQNYYPPDFPHRRLRGWAGSSFNELRGVSRYKFREFKIPELKF